MEIGASLAILPDQCLICLTKVQLLPPPLSKTWLAMQLANFAQIVLDLFVITCAAAVHC